MSAPRRSQRSFRRKHPTNRSRNLNFSLPSLWFPPPPLCPWFALDASTNKKLDDLAAKWKSQKRRRVRQLQYDDDDAVEAQQQRRAGLQRLRPLLQTAQRKYGSYSPAPSPVGDRPPIAPSHFANRFAAPETV